MKTYRLRWGFGSDYSAPTEVIEVKRCVVCHLIDESEASLAKGER